MGSASSTTAGSVRPGQQSYAYNNGPGPARTGSAPVTPVPQRPPFHNDQPHPDHRPGNIPFQTAVVTPGSWNTPPQVSADASSGPSGNVPASESDDGVKACCKFRLLDLSTATSGFSSDNVIGEGGFGKVYRGTLVDGTDVAVKRLDPLSLQGDREFYAEVGMLTRLRHPNLVCIMGMCNEGNQKLGVFEFMSRGSVRELLDKKVVTWKARVLIALGSARGLAYLHEISTPPVIHCDFKSTNVLIDTYGQAHVADFGLARHIGGYRPPVSGVPSPVAARPDVTTVTSIRGTFGYLSPEYLEMGHASVRADVFAFGVVMLELMTGLQPVDTSRGRGSECLADWLRPRLREPEQMFSLLDPAVSEQASPVQVAVMCEIAEACLRANPRERPSMLDVIRTLSAVSKYSEGAPSTDRPHAASDSKSQQATAQAPASDTGASSIRSALQQPHTSNTSSSGSTVAAAGPAPRLPNLQPQGSSGKSPMSDEIGGGMPRPSPHSFQEGSGTSSAAAAAGGAAQGWSHEDGAPRGPSGPGSTGTGSHGSSRHGTPADLNRGSSLSRPAELPIRSTREGNAAAGAPAGTSPAARHGSQPQGAGLPTFSMFGMDTGQ